MFFSSVYFMAQKRHFRKEKKNWNVVESQIHFSAECCLLSTNLTNCGGHFLFILPISVNLPSCVSKSDFFSQELTIIPTCILSIPIFVKGWKKIFFSTLARWKAKLFPLMSDCEIVDFVAFVLFVVCGRKHLTKEFQHLFPRFSYS